MTVNSAYQPKQFLGNGVAQEFAFPYFVADEQHLAVVRTAADGQDSVLVLGTDYSVSGAGTDPGVSVSFPLPGSAYPVLGSGERLTIAYDLPATQETDLANYDALDADVYEAALDKLTRIAQQLKEMIGRCPALPVSLGLTGVELPAPAAGKALAWNRTANGLENADIDVARLGATGKVQEFTAESGQTLFTLTAFSYTPSSRNLAVYRNGLRLESSAYDMTSPTSFTLATPCTAGDRVAAVSVDLLAVADVTAAVDAAEAAQTAAETAETNAEAAQAAAETARSQAQAAALNRQAAVSADDSTPGYLEVKLLAGTGLLASTQNDGGNETRTLEAYVSRSRLTADHSWDGVTTTATAGENLAFGDLAYLKSDGKYWKADADAAATMPAALMALGAINADASGTFLVCGYVRDDSWAWATKGKKLFASTTAGALTDDVSGYSTGDIVQSVGRAATATTVFFSPDSDCAELL